MLVVAQESGEAPPFSTVGSEGAAGLGEAMRFRLPDGRWIVGIDIAIAQSIARALGVGLDLQRGHPTSRSVMDAVSRGDADLGISHLGITADRLQRVLFSAPYASFSASLLIRRSDLPAAGAGPLEISPRSPPVRSLDRPGCRVAVESQSSFEELVPVLFPNATAIPYESDAELIHLLAAQGVDAAVGDEFSLRLLTQIHPELSLYYALLEMPEHQERIAVAISPEMPNLVPIADEVARRLKTQSTAEFFSAYAALLASPPGMAPSSPDHPAPSDPAGPQGRPPGKTRESAALRSEAFPLRPAGAVGLALIAFAAAWLRMSKNPSSRTHEKRPEK